MPPPLVFARARVKPESPSGRSDRSARSASSRASGSFRSGSSSTAREGRRKRVKRAGPRAKLQTFAAISDATPEPRIGDFYSTLDDAVAAVIDYGALTGIAFVRGQRVIKHGRVVRQRVLCKSARQPGRSRRLTCDPANTRVAKSARCGCPARVNIRASGSGYEIKSVGLGHNHVQHFAPGRPPARRPEPAERDLLEGLLKIDSRIGRGKAGRHLAAALPRADAALEPRQLENALAKIRAANLQALEDAGGDAATLLASLNEKKRLDPRWVIHTRFEGNVLRDLFWVTPEQVRRRSLCCG